MSKHTPGPWKYFNEQVIYDAGYGGPFRSVCAMNGNNNEANARLIAAAPEMLEALKALQSIQHRRTGCPDPNCVVCKENEKIDILVASAIEKAEG